MVLDREELLQRVERGMTTAADAEALRRMLCVPPPKRRIAPMSRAVKITDETVREIREEWAAWRRSGVAGQRGAHPRGYGSLGLAFGLSGATVRDLVTGKTRVLAGGPIDARRHRG